MSEGWILAGALDGAPARPALLDDVCGVPHLLRLACDLASAGATRIFIVWDVARALPDLSTVFADPRIRARLEIVTRAPDGDAADEVIVVRGDRVFHRDLPKAVAAGRAAHPKAVVKIAGAEHDAVYATSRAFARELAMHAALPAGISTALARLPLAEVAAPYCAFTASAVDPRALRRAERTLVHSLRKSADGFAAKLLNRRISLPITRLLVRTPIHPNHITLIALALAIAGGFVIARGGYLAGLAGMLLVELGSIVDGIDGELARLRFQYSRTGQWLDTVADDLANMSYASGVMLALHGAGAGWALPVGIAALCAFAATQLTQYALIRFVYGSGDLAAIPWALQTGSDGWLPKLFKRDFVVTLMVVLAALGRLDLILVSFAGGAAVFFAVFFARFARHYATRR